LRLSGDASLCVGELRALGASPDAPVALGHDLSFAVQEAAIGNKYTDRGRAALPERILADHGANFVRLRLWLDPPGGYSNLASVLTMARRAHAAGMKILLDFHYSDFWADPQTQNTPAAWQGQDLATLAHTVRSYTRDVLTALRGQGTPADLVQIGNEIRNGMLWPLGWADAWSGDGWDNLGAMLRAGAAGVADAPCPRPRIVIHFDQGGDNAFSRVFFDRVVAQAVPYDVIGLSYYGYWHGSLAAAQTTLDDVASRYAKPVFIAETAYPFTLAQDDLLENQIDTSSELVTGYPATRAGQLAWMNAVAGIVEAVPDHEGLGVFYWEATWTAVTGNGWDPADSTSGNGWENQALFDYNDRATSAMSWFSHR